MLRTLILENFKSFGSRQTIPLAPITLIFGSNSAGKSSIIQSLLLLKQTAAEPDHPDAFIVPRGDLVDLGTFKDIVHRHDLTKSCEITPLFDPPELPTEIMFQLDNHHTLPAATQIGTGVRISQSKTRQRLKLDALPVYWDNVQVPLLVLQPTTRPVPMDTALRTFVQQSFVTEFSPNHRYVQFAKITRDHPLIGNLWEQFQRSLASNYLPHIRNLLADLESFRSNQAQQSPSGNRARTTRRAGTAKTNRMLQDLLAVIAQYDAYDVDQYFHELVISHDYYSASLRHFLIENAFFRHRHIGGLPFFLNFEQVNQRQRHFRPFPDFMAFTALTSTYFRQFLNAMIYIGPLREFPARHHIYSGNVTQNLGKSGRYLPDVLYTRKDLVTQTNELLSAFDIDYRVDIEKYSRNEGAYGIILYDKKISTTVHLPDVGFGISQVLPVIVQSMLTRQSTILIEQPEIHLHPKLQADLGSLFAKCIREPQGNQFIVETHSEHLILRLQRLIREHTIRPEDISVLYVLKEEAGSRCIPLRIDEDGDFIDEWPEGFFEEGFREMFGAS